MSKLLSQEDIERLLEGKQTDEEIKRDAEFKSMIGEALEGGNTEKPKFVRRHGDVLEGYEDPSWEDVIKRKLYDFDKQRLCGSIRIYFREGKVTSIEEERIYCEE